MEHKVEKLPLSNAKQIICYPYPESPSCSTLIEHLEDIGIEAVLSYGRRRLNKYKVLGIGWASIVVMALWKGSPVAVKILRIDSRRKSLLWEGLLASIAASHDVAPRVHYYSRYAVIQEPILGPNLGEYNAKDCWIAWNMLRRLLLKARILDILGIRHNELARPEKQILLKRNEPYIIDYESATLSKIPHNLTQLIGGLTRLDWIKKVFPGIIEIRTRQLLRQYKQTPNQIVFEEILHNLGEPSMIDCT